MLKLENVSFKVDVDGDVLEIRQAYYAYTLEDDSGVLYIDIDQKENYEEVM